jgi:hypothetical protein
LESHQELPVAEEAVGVAPEVVEKALGRAVRKIVEEVEKVRALVEGVRRAVESRRDLLRVGTAGPAEDLCYAAVDSSFTAPAVELVGGYLGIVLVVAVLYGSRCSSGGVDARAYTELWFNDDLTSTVARYYERVAARRLLERKRRGELDFDVLLLDGEIVPRTLPLRRGLGAELLGRVVDLTEEIARLADESDTAVVGVLKRSYSRDLVSILGFSDLRLSDKAVMSLVLRPGEYLVVGSHADIRRELENLRGRPGAREDWLEARLSWYRSTVDRVPVSHAVKLAFYRAPRTLYPVATKVEYLTSSSLHEDALLSSLIHVSTGTGIPAPVDYADRLSTITRELKQTVYQKLVAEIAKNAGTKDIIPLLSLTNPEKLDRLLS